MAAIRPSPIVSRTWNNGSGSIWHRSTVTDPADARWLLACVWPDSGRAERVEASIRLALERPPALIEGRANDVLPSVLAGLAAAATAIVMTTWAFGYFSIAERAEFLDLLRAESLTPPRRVVERREPRCRGGTRRTTP